MKRLSAEMKQALAEDNFSLYYDRNVAFHDVYLNHSDNPHLVRTVRILKERLYDFPRRAAFVKDWEMSSTTEHDALTKLLERRDIRAAADYVRDVHWSFKVQEPFIMKYYFPAESGSRSGGQS
jgi:DNA-binding GntR family transcriptional regulator